MENQNLEKIEESKMNVEDVAKILSQTLKDVKARKVTLRYALVVSRIALALSKTIEIVELRDRIDLIEQIIKKRK